MEVRRIILYPSILCFHFLKRKVATFLKVRSICQKVILNPYLMENQSVILMASYVPSKGKYGEGCSVS